MHLNPKIIAVYVGMVIMLLVVVSFVLDYGSRNLAAPRDISGQYVIQLTNLPECVRGTEPVLVIGQSGSYLTADLLSSDASEERLSRAYKGNGALTGQVKTDELRLTGAAAYPGSCLENQTLSVKAVLKNDQIKGQIVGNNLTISITGQRST